MSKGRNAPRKQHEKATSPRNAARNEHNPIDRQTPLSEHVPTTPTNPKKAEQPRYKTLEGWYYFFAIVGIPFAIGYAVVTYYQWRDMRRHFEQDQRPYIWLSDKDNPPGGPRLAALQNPDGTISTRVTWSLHFTNYGKAPAQSVTMRVAMVAGNKPGEAMSASVKFDTEKRLPPIPPGKDDFATVLLNNPVNEVQFTELMNIDEAIVARLLVRYSDSSGSPYETRVCVAHLRTGATEYCHREEDNYIK